MYLSRVQERITELFAIFRQQLNSSKVTGKTDPNKASEIVMAQLLSCIYGCDFNNLNHTDRTNYPAIDLADKKKRIAVQVTTTANKEKIIDTLEKFIKYNLHEKFDRLIIYILTEKKSSYPSKTFANIISGKFNFDKDKDILDYSDLLKEISSFNIIKARQIEKILEDNFGNGLIERDIKIGLPIFIPSSIPPLTRFFTGRKDVLGNLSKTLENKKSASLHGMFGLGKTSSALGYAYKNAEKYSQVIFISSTKDQFLQQMANVAELFDKERVKQLKDIKDKALFLRSILDNKEYWSRKDKPWLLIFDNVDDVSEIKSFVPSNKLGHIIFTANSHEIAGLGEEVKIEEIEVQDGKLLLFRRSNNNPGYLNKDILKTNDQTLENIVLELGRSPLAVNIAGAYIFSNKVSFDEYLNLIKSDVASDIILSEEDKADLYQNKNIWKAFEVSYDATCTPDNESEESLLIAKSAMHLLHASVVISPDAIPEELLQTYLLHQGKDFAQIVNNQKLWNKAREKAIRLDLLRFDNSQKMYWTHRLIQRTIWNLIE